MTPTPEPPARMKRVKRSVDAELAAFCHDGLQRAQLLDGAYGRLWQAIAAVVSSGGKRLRPYLATLLYEGMGGKNRSGFMRVATAWELLHLSLLMHDDVIDRDYMRHGVLNVSGQLREAYRAYPYAQDSHAHLADGGAILAGDLLLASAYHWVTTSSFSPEQTGGALQLLHEALFAVVGGELLDVEAAMQPLSGVDTAKIADLKTAQYSVVGPMLTGALLAGTGEAAYDQLRAFGREFGVAYQLQDDLLGVFGDTAKTGKPVGNDLREGKRTILLRYAYEAANETQRATIQTILAQPSIASADAVQLRAVIDKTHAAERVRLHIAGSRDRLVAMAADLPLSRSCRRELQWLIGYALERDV